MEKVLEHDAEVRYFTYNNEMVGARAAPQATDVRESSTFGVCVKLHKVWSPDTSYCNMYPRITTDIILYIMNGYYTQGSTNVGCT